MQDDKIMAEKNAHHTHIHALNESTPPENELIQNIINGNRASFNTLFKQYKTYTFKISFQILKDQDDALDNVNNTWMKIYKALMNSQFDGKSRFSTWIYRITVNEALMHLRSKKTEISLNDENLNRRIEEFCSRQGINIDHRMDRKLRIEKVMRLLTPLQQKVLTYVLEGHTFAHIAEEMDIKPNYLYQLTSRIKKTVQEM